jgi:hypothetical protein
MTTQDMGKSFQLTRRRTSHWSGARVACLSWCFVLVCLPASARAIIVRFQPRGMARALFATALAQALVAVIALIAGLGYPWSGPLEIVA